MLDQLLTWAPLALTAVSVLATAGVWAARKELLTRADFRAFLDRHDAEHVAIDLRLDEGAVKFAKIETTLEHLPTKDDLAAVTSSVAEVTAMVAGLRASVDALDRTMSSVGDRVQMLLQNELGGHRP